MEPVTSAAIQQFIQRLAERYGGAGTLYLLGGGALCLLGSPRETRDVDYTFEVATEATPRFRAALAEVAVELQLDLEDVPIAEFIPLPPEAAERRRALGRYGQLDVYIFDPYTIARNSARTLRKPSKGVSSPQTARPSPSPKSSAIRR